MGSLEEKEEGWDRGVTGGNQMQESPPSRVIQDALNSSSKDL